MDEDVERLFGIAELPDPFDVCYGAAEEGGHEDFFLGWRVGLEEGDVEVSCLMCGEPGFLCRDFG